MHLIFHPARLAEGTTINRDVTCCAEKINAVGKRWTSVSGHRVWTTLPSISSGLRSM